MIIRTATASDIPHIVAIETLPRFRTYIGSWPEEQHRKTIADSDAQYLVAVEKNADEIEGFAILMGLLSEHRSIELKRIAVRTPNRGFGSRLLHAAAALAFNEHRAHRLWLDVFETNARAQHVYEAFGFKRDGIFREAVYRDGSFHSLILMSMLESEYRNLYARWPTPASSG